MLLLLGNFYNYTQHSLTMQEQLLDKFRDKTVKLLFQNHATMGRCLKGI